MKLLPLFFLSAATALAASAATAFNLDSASVADIARAMDAGSLTSERLVSLSLARVQAYEGNLHAIIKLNPEALAEARALDLERRQKGRRSLLHGVPVVVKDCIDVAGLPTSLGFFGLKDSVPYADAAVVRILREAGAIVLAKTNLSELTSGPTMSSLGGQTCNPHDFAYGAAGSSSGTAVGVAAGYAPIGLATDTTGSGRWPAAVNGIVGLRPTLGIIDPQGSMPSEPSLDTIGLMARSVSDVALLVSLLQRVDSRDAAQRDRAGSYPVDFRKGLRPDALDGTRLGFFKQAFTGNDPEVDRVIAVAMEELRARGATIVEVELPLPVEALNPFTDIFYRVESTPAINSYLATLRPGFPRTLAEILAMSERVTGPSAECPYPNPGRLGGYRLQLSGPQENDPVYLAYRDQGRAFLRQCMEAMIERDHLDAFVYPTSDQRIPRIDGPARRGAKGHWGNAGEGLASLIGWPDLSVPAGFTTDGLPVGLSFVGPAFADQKILALGFAFEQAAHGRRQPAGTPGLPGERFEY